MEKETRETSSTDQRVTSPNSQGNLDSGEEGEVDSEELVGSKIATNLSEIQGAMDPSESKEMPAASMRRLSGQQIDNKGSQRSLSGKSSESVGQNMDTKSSQRSLSGISSESAGQHMDNKSSQRSLSGITSEIAGQNMDNKSSQRSLSGKTSEIAGQNMDNKSSQRSLSGKSSEIAGQHMDTKSSQRSLSGKTYVLAEESAIDERAYAFDPETTDTKQAVSTIIQKFEEQVNNEPETALEKSLKDLSRISSSYLSDAKLQNKLSNQSHAKQSLNKINLSNDALSRDKTSDQVNIEHNFETANKPLEPKSSQASHNGGTHTSDLDDFEEYGAAGGPVSNERPTSAKRSGKLSASVSKKLSITTTSKPSLLRSTELMEESNPHREIGPQRPVLAHGDGLSTQEPLQPMATQSIPNVRPSRTSNPGSSESLQASTSSSGSQVQNISNRTAIKETSQTHVTHTPVKRTDSIGMSSVSPTDMLRKKQKQVTDRIMKSMSASRSGEFNMVTSSQQSFEKFPTTSGYSKTEHTGGSSMTKDNDNAGINTGNGKDSETVSSRVSLKNVPGEPANMSYISTSGDDGGSSSSVQHKTSAALVSDLINGNSTFEDLNISKEHVDTKSSSQALLGHPSFQKHKKVSDRQIARQSSTSESGSFKIKEKGKHVDSDLNSDNQDDSRQQMKQTDLQDTLSYTTPSKLLRKIEDRERNDVNFPGPGAISFTSPSKLLQKIEDRERNDETFPGVGTLSYTTPSELLRDGNNREQNEENGFGNGSYSYTTTSGLMMKIETTEPNEGNNFLSEKVSSHNDRIHIPQTFGNSETTTNPQLDSVDDIGINAVYDRDDQPKIDTEGKQSSLTGQNIPGHWFFKNGSSSSNSSSQSAESPTQMLNSKTRHVPDSRNSIDTQAESVIQEVLHDEAAEETAHLDIARLDLSDIPVTLKYMNTLLTDFLAMLSKKRQRGEVITAQDYQELTLIERAIEAFASQIIRSVGNIEGDQLHEQYEEEEGMDLSYEKQMKLASNLKHHLSLLAAAKLGMRERIQAQSANCLRDGKTPESKELKKTSADRSKSSDVFTFKQHKAEQQRTAQVNAATVTARKTRKQNLNQAFRAIKENDCGKMDVDMAESSAGGSNAYPCSKEQSLLERSGYLGDISSESLGTSLSGWNFSNEFLKETAFSVAGNFTSEEMFGPEITPSPSVSLEIVGIPEDSAGHITHDSSKGSFCDCFECRKQFFYWNKRLGMAGGFDRIKQENNDYRNEASRIANAGSECIRGTPYPSSVYLTTNPSYSNLSDYSDMDESDTEHVNRKAQQWQDIMDDEIQTAWYRSPTEKLYQRGDAGMAKRKQAGRSLTPDSKYMLDKEVVETQNRKLQTEISTLQTENKLLKEKYNRSQARINELEEQLNAAQDDLSSLQESLNQEVSSLSVRTRQEIDRGRDDLQTRVVALTKQNDALKAEIASVEKHLESSNRTVDMVRHNSEKTRTLDAHKREIASLKEELSCVKALLDQSERHLREEEERHSAVGTQVVKLTELKNALQQQQDSGSGGTVGDKQLKSLEKRLAVTEERLHQERADRANNLSAVEDKLLTENARLQAVEKDITRQLHREKEKNRNLDHRVKQVRDENEKLRLAMPFDDSQLLEEKQNYDIPYSSHSNQRAETVKHISDDMNYILSQIEKQDGLHDKSDQEEMIRTIWNKRELAYKQLREYELNFEELHLNDNNIMDGLKNLRDTYGQAESKLKAMEEQVEDARSQMATLEVTYKEQLNMLVRERHDAFARLKTAEDILTAVRAENEMLRQNVHVVQSGEGGKHTLHNGVSGSLESLQMEIANLESKVAQLTRTNQRLEGELSTARTQVDARNMTLQDVQSELDLAYNRLKGEDTEDRKQTKIDKLSSEVSGLQVELKMLTDKYNSVMSDNSRLESELAGLRKTAEVQKARQQKSGQTEGKVQQQLKDELAEKESSVACLTKQQDDLENELQKNRQELYIEQMHNSELESEVESLRQTVEQRAQMFESLSGTEREQLAQYQIIKETLDSVNQELAQKHAQIISLDVNLSGQKDRTAELEADLEKLRRDKGASDVDYTDDEQDSAQQLKISELERERSQLKQELVQAYNAIQAAEEQYRTLQTESKQLEQELVKEKTVILQITAEKGEVEQHLEELAEEHDSLIQEKNQCEEDLIRLETKLQEILQKYETEARKQHADFQKEYPNLPPEAKKLVSELDSLRLLVEGKDREIGMLHDKNNRQQVDIEFLHRKVELVHNDSISNREDVARMISELTLKMKEAVSTREVNQFLVAERTKLQNAKSHLENELEQERKHSDQRKREVEDVLRKVQGTESKQKTVERDSRDKDALILSLQADLRTSKQNFASAETEMEQLKTKMVNLTEDIRKLTGINMSMENQLETKSNQLLEDSSALSKLKEEFNRMSHDFELLQHEHAVLSDKHDANTQTIENLRRELSTREEENSSLTEELHGTRLDLESQKGQLLLTKDTVQKLTQDKGSIYQDYEGMCRTVTEKERQLAELRDRSEEQLNHLQKQHLQENTYLKQTSLSAEKEKDVFKRELETVKEQLKQKEIQLNTFGKTLQELESVTRQKKQLEAQLYQLESSSGDSKVLLEGQRKELMSLNEALAKQQDRATRMEAENHTLKADLKVLKDSANRESQELSITVKELKSQHENERTYLNDNLAKTQTQLHALQSSLVSTSNDRDTLHAQKRMSENTLEQLQSQLSDESTGRRLAEQSVGQLRLQLEDMRNDKNVSEARYTEMKHQLSKAEDQLKAEQDKHKRLTVRVQEMTAFSQTSESTAKAKAEQVETLQKEISKLKQIIESQKQNMTGKMKKVKLEFKQQLDLVQEDRDKLMIQVQKLSTDLESCREQLALKNKDNLKLQEDILVLEDSVRECKAKQKQAEDTLKVETEKLSTMASRFMEQDEELKRLRNFLAKKVEDSGEADKSMWQEMNRVIQDLSRQMHDHLDAQKSEGKDGNSHSQVVLRYKKQLAEMQGELGTEKSLHQITKTSLQALEEDCQRLRHQLHAMRRREPASTEKTNKSPSPRKYKNRMEAINAIIARSQTQAQALLASGGFYDNMNSPRVPNSARAGYHTQDHAESPDNSYSEDLSIASLPPLHYGSSTKK